ncbi:hypothetical protein FB384_003570 [Prauserella sediminis]|uniref:Uncharacterized protein n=1 Tax=Prauserella sediminis TaxID=577680 RepID=A0A839XXC0_9PSEU|nr:hypothetical protein [Prauserella sediminis]
MRGSNASVAAPDSKSATFATAAVFSAPWSGLRYRNTGWSPAAASSSSRVGSLPSARFRSCHPPASPRQRIQAPGRSEAARSRTRAHTSVTSRAWPSASMANSWDTFSRCMCVSMKPGSTAAPSSCVRRVRGPASRSSSSSEPVATMRLFPTASAEDREAPDSKDTTSPPVSNQSTDTPEPSISDPWRAVSSRSAH